MSTVVGVECTDGALVAGDRRLVNGGQVRSRSKRHAFPYDGVAAAAVGAAGAIDAFERRLDEAIREYRTERGEIGIEALARLGSAIATDAGVDAVVAGDDDEGVARIRGIDQSGATFDDPVVAFGSGTHFVLGSLEQQSKESLDSAEMHVREAFAAAAERDTGTGVDVDVVRIE